MSDSDITTTNPVKRVIAKSLRPGFLLFCVFLSVVFTLVFRWSTGQFFELIGLCILWSVVLDSLYEVYLRVRK